MKPSSIRRRFGFWTGLGFTLVISAFLILPVLVSVLPGVTARLVEEALVIPVAVPGIATALGLIVA